MAERKNFMKKKLISLLLSATMIASLCACGNDATKTGISETSKTSESTVTSEVPSETGVENQEPYPIVNEEITIRGLVVGADTTVSKDRTVWQKVEEVTGINIEWEFIDSEALATYLAGGDWPDFFLTSFSDAIVNDYGISGGKFVNLLEYLDYMPNLVQTFEDYPVAKAVATEINGEMYEFPGITDSVTAVFIKPFYRTDMFEAAGVKEAPKTVEDFYNALVAVKNNTGEAPWIPCIDQEQYCWTLPIYSAFGTGNSMCFDVDENGNVYFARTTEQMKQYYLYMNKLYEEGLLHKECATIENNTRTELEQSGKAAIIELAASSLTEKDFDSGKVELAALAPLTSEFDSTQTYQDRPQVEFKFGPFLNAESDYVVEMCKMFDIMYATEEVVEGTGLYGQAFCYGLEGVDWKWTETGGYEQFKPDKYDAVNTYLASEVNWYSGGMGRYDAFGGVITEVPGNNQTRQIGYAENVIPYETEEAMFIWGFLKFTEDEQYVLDNKWSDIRTYYMKMNAEFITGVTDIEVNWDAYLAELDKMGLKDVLDVYQAAYDRWVSFQ